MSTEDSPPTGAPNIIASSDGMWRMFGMAARMLATTLSFLDLAFGIVKYQSDGRSDASYSIKVVSSPTESRSYQGCSRLNQQSRRPCTRD